MPVFPKGRPETPPYSDRAQLHPFLFPPLVRDRRASENELRSGSKQVAAQVPPSQRGIGSGRGQKSGVLCHRLENGLSRHRGAGRVRGPGGAGASPRASALRLFKGAGPFH